MTSKHTPGPWFTVPYNAIERIAVYSGHDGHPPRGIGEVWDINDHPQNEANARLIAMAPRMYEVLQALVRGYEHGTGIADKVLVARTILNELETDQ